MEAVAGGDTLSAYTSSLIRSSGAVIDAAPKEAQVYVSTICHFVSKNAGRAHHPSPEQKYFVASHSELERQALIVSSLTLPPKKARG